MYDYAWVHVVYTIPVAAILTIVLAPLFTRLDLYKICFLIIVAFSYTLPWDSYLVRNRIWSYPPDSILGPTVLSVPVEELFFFVIQTYITACPHILLNKPVLTAVYLRNEASVGSFTLQKRIGQLIFTACFVLPLLWPTAGHTGTYLKLIVVWVAPIFLMLWTFAYQLILSLPLSKMLFPIAAPTLFLWIVDTLALRRGTWSIESGTKLGIHLWPHLEVEEALFFLVTNAMIVMGSCAFDNAVAVLDTFPNLFPKLPGLPSPLMMLKGLFTSTSEYDQARLDSIGNALSVLAKKSRSFYLASGVFNGRLRIDLILLYGFCRVADDLIDNAPTSDEAQDWIQSFTEFLDAAYSTKTDSIRVSKALAPFPPKARSILKYLPIDKLPAKPLYCLLDGFRIDVKFSSSDASQNPPIQTEQDLEKYATCVAATIGELCLSLVYAHDPDKTDSTAHQNRKFCTDAGIQMGRVLQYVNIVRDVTVDAESGRCYIPSDWFSSPLAKISPSQRKQEVFRYRKRILDTAFENYGENRDAIEDLPKYARGGIRVAVESYMEIGRTLRYRMCHGLPLDFSGGGRQGRASVPRARRIWVGWTAMLGWRGSK